MRDTDLTVSDHHRFKVVLAAHKGRLSPGKKNAELVARNILHWRFEIGKLRLDDPYQGARSNLSFPISNLQCRTLRATSEVTRCFSAAIQAMHFLKWPQSEWAPATRILEPDLPMIVVVTVGDPRP